MATVRHHVVIDCAPDAAWELLGDASRVAEWFPGIERCDIEGDRRTVHLASGLSLPERIVTTDAIQRRFQYSLDVPLVAHHLSTIDVLDLGDGRCCCVYGCDAEPAVMSLVIGGSAGDALERAKQILEGVQ